MFIRVLLLALLVPFLSIASAWSAPSVVVTDHMASTVESDQRLARGEVPRVMPSSRQALNTQGMSHGMKPPEELRLNLEGRDIVIIYSTGTVQLGEGLTVDEASRDFWRKVGELAPGFCHERQQTK